MKGAAVPVLMYHHISPDREVTPEQFEGQLRLLRDKGYYTPDLAGARALLSGEAGARGKPVLLTFDDGYADNWICAWPLLKKYGFRAVIFVTTSRLTEGPARPTLADGAVPPGTLKDERGPAGFLTWSELKAMTSSGVFEAGSHTHTHRDFVKRSAYKDLDAELGTSASLIERHTGARPVSIGWPWGHHEKSWEGAVRRAGYTMAFTTVTGVNRPGCDLLYLKRIKVSRGGLSWFRSRLLLHGLPLVSDLYGKLYGLDRKLKRRRA
ncbi:MAG: polysaccharide deacetylase family protein [Elusimicrobia bacterium]|nr:polysaccharide deacetylase family protein [Elusimicrobiota bacterium]